MRTLLVQGLNVSLHDQHDYADLFRALYNAKRPIRVRGDHHLLLSSIERRRTSGASYLFGTIARFSKIDRDGDWLNTASLERATEEEKRSIAIPENLMPNLKSFFYAFFPDRHKLIFEARGIGGSLSPNSVATMIERLAAGRRVSRVFGPVNVNPIHDHDQLANIFDIERIKRVKIEITRPNPDDWENVETRVRNRLRRERARKITTIIEADRGESLLPSDETKTLALVASRNGNATVEGQDNGVREVRQLKDFPLEVGHRYDPDVASEDQGFRAATRKYLSKLDDAEDDGVEQ